MVVFIVPIAILILFFLYNRLFARRWSRGLGCTLEFEREYVTEGECCDLSEVLTNRKSLPLLFLQVKFNVRKGIYAKDYPNASVSDQSYFNEVFSLRPYERVKRKLELVCEKRGFYNITTADLIGVNLMAGEKYYEKSPQSTSIYVLPSTIEADMLTLPFEHLMGEEQRRSYLYEDPFTFRGIREYMPRDSMKNINWKMTAKSGELKVNQRDSTTSRQITILLNLKAPAGLFDTELLEDGIRLAYTMSEQFARAHVRTALYTNGVDCLSGQPFYIDGGETGEHIRSIAQGLARIDLTLDMPDFEEITRGAQESDTEKKTTFCIISTSIRNEVILAAKPLTGGGTNLVWLCPQKKTMEYCIREGGIDFFRINTR